MYEELQGDQPTYICKFQLFKQDYLALRKLYQDSQQENELKQKYIALLENRLSLADKNSIFQETLEKQETIVEYLLKKDNYLTMQNLCSTLQNQVQELEKKLQTEEAFYEEEMKNATAKIRKETVDLNEENEKNCISRIEQLEISNQELTRTNELLKTLMDEFTIEAENERAFLNAQNLKYSQEVEQQKETIRVLESKNNLLFSQLVQQENLFEENMRLLEKQKDETLKNALSNNSSQTDFIPTEFIQTLDEAFCITEETIREAKTESLFTPFTTSDCPELQFFLDNELQESRKPW